MITLLHKGSKVFAFDLNYYIPVSCIENSSYFSFKDVDVYVYIFCIYVIFSEIGVTYLSRQDCM